MNSRLPSILFGLLLAAGCRAHPCGDQSAELPAVLSSLPLLEDGGKVCDARGSEATLLYWGDTSKSNELSATLLAKMDGAGWAQHVPSGPYAPPMRDGEHFFRKGAEELYVSFEMTETPRLGSKLLADTVRVVVRHHATGKTPN